MNLTISLYNAAQATPFTWLGGAGSSAFAQVKITAPNGEGILVGTCSADDSIAIGRAFLQAAVQQRKLEKEIKGCSETTE